MWHYFEYCDTILSINNYIVNRKLVSIIYRWWTVTVETSRKLFIWLYPWHSGISDCFTVGTGLWSFEKTSFTLFIFPRMFEFYYCIFHIPVQLYKPYKTMSITSILPVVSALLMEELTDISNKFLKCYFHYKACDPDYHLLELTTGVSYVCDVLLSWA